MKSAHCPDCGQPTAAEATACVHCGCALLTNGAATEGKKLPENLAAPPEANGWILYPTPPEILEEMRHTFNEEEFLAELRQAEQAGLPELKDLIRDLEQETAPHD